MNTNLTVDGVAVTDPVALAITSAGLATVLLLVLAFWVLLVIARWKMFTKAGEAGWKSIIPIYADYIGYKLWWDTKNFWIFFASAVVYSIAYGVLQVGVNGSTTTIDFTSNPVMSLLASVAGIVLIVWDIRYCLKTVRAYGGGTGMGILMVLFPNIISLILGFGKAKYVGPQK